MAKLPGGEMTGYQIMVKLSPKMITEFDNLTCYLFAMVIWPLPIMFLRILKLLYVETLTRNPEYLRVV